MSTGLAPFQQRVVDERTELNIKRDKLTEFMKGDIFKTLDGPEKRRLQRQLTIMESYSNVLSERIVNFK